MATDRLSGSNELIHVALARARGRIPASRLDPERQGFSVLRASGELHGGEQPMSPKEYSSQDKSPESRVTASARFRRARQVNTPVEFGSRGLPPVEIKGVAWGPGNPERQVGVFGRSCRFEPVTHGVEENFDYLATVLDPLCGQASAESSILNRIISGGKEVREKEVEAIGEFTSDTIGSEFIAALISPEHISGFPIVEAADLSDAVSESCRHLTQSLFKGIGSGVGIPEVGISGVILTFAAGTSAEVAIAPIAKKCGVIARALSFGGILLGVVTGNHILVIICTKKLLINQAERMLAKSVAEFFQGSGTDADSGVSKLSTSVHEIPTHILAVTPDTLDAKLGQDIEQWSATARSYPIDNRRATSWIQPLESE